MLKKRQYPKIIVFFGPDGAGKTTHARILRKYLFLKKFPVSYVWMRGTHTLAYLLSIFFIKCGYYKKIQVPSGLTYSIFDPNTLPKLNKLWRIIEFISILPHIIKIHLYMFFGRIVISDRYVIDNIVHLSYFLGNDVLQSIVTKFLLRLIPKKGLLFHIDAPINILISRLHYDTTTICYLKYQKIFYKESASLLDVVTIDTSKTNIEETFGNIRKILEKCVYEHIR